jgi:hypothetical protein
MLKIRRAGFDHRRANIAFRIRVKASGLISLKRRGAGME